MVRRTCPSIALMLFVAILLPLLAFGRSVRAAEERSYKYYRDQGIHYYRKKRLEPALSALEKAGTFAEADSDYKTHLYLAKVYYDLLLLEKAFPEARKAVALASSDAEQKEATGLLKGLEDFFGGVTFRMAPEQKDNIKSGIIYLEDRGGLINIKKKEVFSKIKQRFHNTPIELPLTIYLPYGSYAANRAPFEIKKGEMVPEVELFLTEVDSGISPWWYVGGGVAAVAATISVMTFLLGSDAPHQTMTFGDVTFTGGGPSMR